MKKKTIIIIISLICLIGIINFLLWKNDIIFNKEKTESNTVTNKVKINTNDETKYLEKTESNIIKDKETGRIVYDPTEKYSPLIERTIAKDENYANEILEYLKYFSFVYPMQSFDQFDDETIAVIVSLASGLYEPRTEKEIERTAERYFGIKNYKLPTGTYELEKYFNYTITKINGYYVRSDVHDEKKLEIIVFSDKVDVSGNNIVITVKVTPNNENDCYSPLEPKEECVMGYYKIYLTDKGDNILNINKIEYNSNPNYIGTN